LNVNLSIVPVVSHLDDLIIIPALVAFAVRPIPQDVLAELFSPATALSSPPMAQLALHHVNLIVTDLPVARFLSEPFRPQDD
jgi:hypothetical protein